MKRDPYKDDQLLELIDDLCNFIMDQIVHVKGTSKAPTMTEILIQVEILSTNTFVRLKGQLQAVDNNVYEI